MKIFVLKPLGFRKLSYFSEMRNDALMHREGLKGYWRPLQNVWLATHFTLMLKYVKYPPPLQGITIASPFEPLGWLFSKG